MVFVVGCMNASIQEFPAHSREASSPAPFDMVVQGLTKNFSTIERAIDNISFEVTRGQAVALIGSDSSGKSTLLRCCAGLMSPDAGSVRIFDKELCTLSVKERQKVLLDVGFLNGGLEHTSEQKVEEVILAGAKPRLSSISFFVQKLFNGRLKKQVKELLSEYNLEPIKDKLLRELSPFEHKLVLLASLRMQGIKVLLADDPVSGLDVANAEKFMAILLQTVRGQGMTLIFTSRELIDALAYADRAIALLQGRLELDAPVGAEDARVLRTLAG